MIERIEYLLNQGKFIEAAGVLARHGGELSSKEFNEFNRRISSSSYPKGGIGSDFPCHSGKTSCINATQR